MAFPMIIPMLTKKEAAYEPQKMFNTFRAEIIGVMKEQFELNDNRVLSPEDQGFCLNDYPMRLGWVPPGATFWSMIKSAWKRRMTLGKIRQYDKSFNWEDVLVAAPPIVHKISSQLAKGDITPLEGRLEPSLLQRLKERADQLTPSQREVLNFEMDDYILPSPMLLDIEQRVEGRQTFIDFFCYDVAVYQVKKLEFDFARKKGLKMHDYKFAFPRQIISNIVFTRQLEPTLSDEFLVTQFNIIVAP
uniref:Uncharacterized protein n=1 Tax=Plectus sambesii TaxID=2011161 RepID=A0A914WLG2_9BILA